MSSSAPWSIEFTSRNASAKFLRMKNSMNNQRQTPWGQTKTFDPSHPARDEAACGSIPKYDQARPHSGLLLSEREKGA
ncbi:hypothetical protein Plim_3432 [Planctopirus limnophila DSM 3776]|uniref:Uncharacterized protein n=1 Tax=Planctopirus limnophila (strain ATCC 43296 / DSM 3776 / IFAM 1008 / Mu 290) TaxID=521674 RepID=D5SUV9_PLAL2|nr:hypothetical protein [Planctopirus limnophila]ADG69245.1 hypothetical protein Plim_3432 [Planctopirus limnophila DSM 3776]